MLINTSIMTSASSSASRITSLFFILNSLTIIHGFHQVLVSPKSSFQYKTFISSNSRIFASSSESEESSKNNWDENDFFSQRNNLSNDLKEFNSRELNNMQQKATERLREKLEAIPEGDNDASNIMNEIRTERILKESLLEEQFLSGDELHELRLEIQDIEKDLRKSIKERDSLKAEVMRQKLREHQNKDPEFVYKEKMIELEKARNDGSSDKRVKKLEREVSDVRSSITQLNLEGLWVGKYGSHGYELINVTYTGDTMIAYKLTGDKNVPKGEITFKVDLSHDKMASDLDPIALTESASKQWGIQHLFRFVGHGQVASEGFKSPQWMDGQLIMVGDYFSFAWVPIGHQIFFGRPSGELVLKMLKDYETNAIYQNQDSKAIIGLLKRCLSETEYIEHEGEKDFESNIFFDGDDELGAFQ